MRRVLSLRAEAQADIAAAHNWYISRLPAKAPLLLEAVDEALNLIEAGPLLYAVRPNGLRRINLKSFPFALAYSIETAFDPILQEEFERVLVFACFHQSQDIDALLHQRPIP